MGVNAPGNSSTPLAGYDGRPCVPTQTSLAPFFPLLATPPTVSPPTGVAVTVTLAVASDCTDTDPGDAASTMPGANVTCAVNVPLAVRPSPAAVTVTVPDSTFAVELAVSASVSTFVLTLPAGVIGFADQTPVTPLGKPLTLQLIAPLYDPPVVAVRLTLAVAPCATVAVLAPTLNANVGGAVTASA